MTVWEEATEISKKNCFLLGWGVRKGSQAVDSLPDRFSTTLLDSGPSSLPGNRCWLGRVCMCVCVCVRARVSVCACLVAQLCLILCNPMDCSPPGSSIHGDSPGKNTGVGCHALLQGIFPTQVSNPGFPHCRWILYHLSHQGSPRKPYRTKALVKSEKMPTYMFWILYSGRGR